MVRSMFWVLKAGWRSERYRRARRIRGCWSRCRRRACGASGPAAQPAAGDRLLPGNGADGFFDLARRRPEAKVPPTRAPMLVPTTQSMGMRNSSSAASTPTWAAPLAPPPPSTSPMRGRGCNGASTTSPWASSHGPEARHRQPRRPGAALRTREPPRRDHRIFGAPILTSGMGTRPGSYATGGGLATRLSCRATFLYLASTPIVPM